MKSHIRLFQLRKMGMEKLQGKAKNVKVISLSGEILSDSYRYRLNVYIPRT